MIVYRLPNRLSVTIISLIMMLSCISGRSPSFNRQLNKEQLKEDLNLAFERIEQIHPNMYAYVTEKEFSDLKANLYEQTTQSMTRLEFYKLLAPVVSSLKNGHTLIFPPNEEFAEYRRKGGKVYPLDFFAAEKKIFLRTYYGKEMLPIGAEVLTLDNRNAREYLEYVCRYSPSERKAYNFDGLDDSLKYFLWLEKKENEPLFLTTRTSETSNVQEFDIEPIRYGDFVKAAGKLNKIIRSYKKYSFSHDKIHDVGVITFNSFDDLEKFKIFLNKNFTYMQNHNVEQLVLDLRRNRGGDNRLGDELLKYLTNKPFKQFEKCQIKISSQLLEKEPYLAKNNNIGSTITKYANLIDVGKNLLRFDGEVYVLIGPRTASSAMGLAATIKHYNLGTLIGYETIDTPVNYGHCLYTRLPNSGLKLSVAGKYFECVGAKDDGRGVLPDYEVWQRPEDTARGADTVLEFTLGLISSTKKTTRLEKD